MDKSSMFVGGVMGAVMAIAIVAILFTLPSESANSDIVMNDDHTPVAEASSLYSNDLSLIEIFEKSESGVVRVNVQRNQTEDVVGE